MASLSLYTVVIIINLASILQAKVIYEDGYTVSTVLDGHKLNINPYSVASQSGPSDLIILDSVNSVFYSLKLPISQNSEVKRLSGNGSCGYGDGEEAESVMFNNPKSFAVDLKGNVYVAHKDKNRATIRKISSSGVTTIAGGYSEKPGRKDGPAQSASFSDTFELAFVPEICALLISDLGNQLIRQIDLRPDDCRPQSSKSEGSSEGATCETWKKYQLNLVNQVLMLCFVIRSAIVSPKLKALPMRLIRLSLSYLSLVFGVNIVRKRSQWVELVSLLDSDVSSSYQTPKSLTYDDQLKDLLFSNETHKSSNLAHVVDAQLTTSGETNYDFSDTSGKVDSMMQISLNNFAAEI